jgi:hypothetical protein
MGMEVRCCRLYSAFNITVLQMCVTVNDLEYVRRSLSVLGAELHVETILEAVDAATGDAGRQQWRKALYAMLEGAINQLEARALQVINRVAAKVRHYLSAGYGFNLGYCDESLNTFLSSSRQMVKYYS